jgi:hypothetical protein
MLDCGGPEQLRANESDTVVAVAALSQTLGKQGLPAVAKNIRACWPSASILILGDVDVDLEAALYDAVIDHRSRPEDLLVALALLVRNRWATSTAPHNRSEHIAVLAPESDGLLDVGFVGRTVLDNYRPDTTPVVALAVRWACSVRVGF